MAIRKIVLRGEEILGKHCKPVKEVNERIRVLAEDMIETMIDADGVGLAAPQVGVMKRLFVCRPILEEPEHYYVFINPEITEREGSQESVEGCLSVPGYVGKVERPMKVHIRGLDKDGKEQDLEFEGFAATCICHEYDHLDGILYTDIADRVMTNEEYSELLQEQQAEQKASESEK